MDREVRFVCGVATVEVPPQGIDQLVRLADEDMQVRKRRTE
jgi:hypothetical protein